MSGASEDQWEKTIDNLIKRSIYGGVAGGLAAILLFRNPTSRACMFTFGLGCGVGGTYIESSKQIAAMAAGIADTKKST